MNRIIKISIFIFVFNIVFSEEYSGYLREIEMSFCMDDCSHFYLESEEGESISNISFNSSFNSDLYINRYIHIEGEEIWCVECGAIEVEQIELSTECNFPVFCFADPCEVAEECQINTPVECVPNYCGGCYADFYDLDGTLVDCPDSYELNPCDDIGNAFFGLCDMFLGYAIVNGLCEGVSGCSWEIDGIDYSEAFFDSLNDCEENCLNEPYLCEDIEYDYDQLHSGIYSECNNDEDCVAVWGACDVGLGGCHYAVNEHYSQDDVNNLIDLWNENDCMEWVCDCALLPNTLCNNDVCELAYCYDPNPAGCFQTGCPDNYGCIDYEEGGDCVPSSCSCDEFYGDWFCTEDCNGGTCFDFGDVNFDNNIDVVDVVSLVNMILNMTPGSLSDINSDGTTNVVDVVLIVNIILN